MGFHRTYYSVITSLQFYSLVITWKSNLNTIKSTSTSKKQRATSKKKRVTSNE